VLLNKARMAARMTARLSIHRLYERRVSILPPGAVAKSISYGAGSIVRRADISAHIWPALSFTRLR
jgi:hypothetical protein